MIQLVKQGAVSVFQDDEPLIGDRVPRVAAAVEECLAAAPPLTVLDMSRMPLIDSAGIELLLDLHDAFAARGGAIKVATPGGLCRDALMVNGVDNQIELYDDVTSAVRSFLR